MNTSPEWWPASIEEWLGLLMSIDCPDKAIKLEMLAREFARHPERPEPRQFFENLLDTSSSLEFELQCFIAISDDERRRRLRVVEK